MVSLSSTYFGYVNSTIQRTCILAHQSCRTNTTVCLNRKITVDRNGNIKNCPSMIRSYGHMMSDSLKDVVLQAGFKKIWGLSKDGIEVCSDCEFRYICVDCRAYVVNSNKDNSKSAKCSYDPYTASWSNEGHKPRLTMKSDSDPQVV